MANPIFDNTNMPQNIGVNMNGVKQLANMYKNAQNPMAMLQSIAGQNPQIAQVINMINGKNPEEIFYALCKKKGVNSDDILIQFKW